MCFVYILRSRKNNKRYVGCTSREVQDRLYDHNVGSGRWTRQNGPFELIHAQDCIDIKDAKELERFLKSGQGRQCLDELGL
jgi:predicted GIY-YIG superfamily endonuclease